MKKYVLSAGMFLSGLFSLNAQTSIPYTDDFETTSSLWSTTLSGTGSDWELGTPNYGSTTGAYSGTKAWDINLTSRYSSGADVELYSPVFDFSQAVNAKLSFWHNFFTESSYDGVRLEYTTDGSTWAVLGANSNDPNIIANWYTNTSILSSNEPAWDDNSGGWIKSEYSLTQLNNETGPVQFRFVFTSDGSVEEDGYSLDNFSITLQSATDIAVDSLASPAAMSCFVNNTTETVSINLKNVGSQAITGPFNVSYQVDNNPPVTEQFSGTINSAQTSSYTFTAPLAITPGLHSLLIYSSVNGDGDNGNDTLEVKYSGVDAVSVPYMNDFESANSLDSFCITTTQQGQVGLSSSAGNAGTQGVFFDASANTDWDQSSDTITGSPNYVWNSTTSDQQYSSLRLLVNTQGQTGLALKFDAQFLYYITENYTNFRVTVNGTMITPHFQSSSSTSSYDTYVYSLNSFLPANVLAIQFESKSKYDALNDGCGTFFDNLLIDITSSVEQAVQYEGISISASPNPAKETVQLNYSLPENGQANLFLRNMLGQEVLSFSDSQQAGMHQWEINVNELPNGIYFYELNYGSYRIVKKLVVSH